MTRKKRKDANHIEELVLDQKCTWTVYVFNLLIVKVGNPHKSGIFTKMLTKIPTQNLNKIACFLMELDSAFNEDGSVNQFLHNCQILQW